MAAPLRHATASIAATAVLVGCSLIVPSEVPAYRCTGGDLGTCPTGLVCETSTRLCVPAPVGVDGGEEEQLRDQNGQGTEAEDGAPLREHHPVLPAHQPQPDRQHHGGGQGHPPEDRRPRRPPDREQRIGEHPGGGKGNRGRQSEQNAEGKLACRNSRSRSGSRGHLAIVCRPPVIWHPRP